MDLRYIPVNQSHVQEHNKFVLKVEIYKALDGVLHYLEFRGETLCIVVKGTDFEHTLDVLYKDDHRHYLTNKLGMKEREWLRENMPRAMTQDIEGCWNPARGKTGEWQKPQTYIYFVKPEDAIKYQLACG